MDGDFKPVRFTVLIGVTAIMVCGIAVFCTHRMAHGTTAEERAAYQSGEKAGANAPSGATLPMEAELDITAEKYFQQQGPTEQFQNPSRAGTLEACKRAFQKGYTTGFKKTHSQR